MRGSRCSVLSGSVIEDILQGLLVDIAVELCEIRRQLDVLRASFDTVLAVAAARDAALLLQSVQAQSSSVSTLSRSGPTVRTFLKFSCHKGFSGDTLREARSLAGLQPLKSQTPSFLGVSCFTCRILIIEK